MHPSSNFQINTKYAQISQKYKIKIEMITVNRSHNTLIHLNITLNP